MSDETAPEPAEAPEPQAPEGNPKDLAQVALVAKLVMDTLKGMGADARAGLLPLMQHLGSTQQTIAAADDVKMGTVSLVGGSARARVTDERAFLDHCVEHYPGEVVQMVRESFVTAMLARADEIGEPIDTDGRIIPGVEFVRGNPYLRILPSKAARERMGAILEDAGWLRQLPAGFTNGNGAQSDG